MYCRQTKVFLRDVDATGAIYFTELFRYVAETFELWTEEKIGSLTGLFSKGCFFPIVHASGDYLSPLKLGDEIDVTVRLQSRTLRSITIGADIVNLSTGVVAGRVTIVHAFVKDGENRGSPVPEEIAALLA